MVLIAAGLLPLVGFGLHAWISGRPVWPGIAAGGTAFAGGVLLFLIGLGREFRWWSLDGSAYDALAKVWVWITVPAAAVAGVAAYFAS